MTFWAIQTLNGVSFGMLLFLLAAGLSLIFGLMRILNLAHGSYYLLGAYVALSVVNASGSFVLAAAAGIAAVVVLGVVMERVFLRRLPREGRHDGIGRVARRPVTGDTDLRLLPARLDVGARCGFGPGHERQRNGKRRCRRSPCGAATACN